MRGEGKERGRGGGGGEEAVETDLLVVKVESGKWCFVEWRVCVWLGGREIA